jgi:Mrp family chromosome partitioning ATPase
MDKPDNANQGCPGTESANAGKEDGCAGCPNQKICQAAKDAPPAPPTNEELRTAERLALIKHKLLILSGKGGVGKSTVTSQLAFGLASMGFQVGVLDVDLCGPSIPRAMGLEGADVHSSIEGWDPVCITENLCVMSVGFLFSSKDDALIWRGPKKTSLIRQFLSEVNWGELDFLLIDTPPGTSDEHISITQMLKLDPFRDGAVLVTTGQKLAVNAVRKEVNFCKKTNTRILGVIENMKNLLCNHCGVKNDLFVALENTEVSKMVHDYQLDVLGEIGFSPELLACVEAGKSIFEVDAEVLKNTPRLAQSQADFKELIRRVLHLFEVKLDQRDDDSD